MSQNLTEALLDLKDKSGPLLLSKLTWKLGYKSQDELLVALVNSGQPINNLGSWNACPQQLDAGFLYSLRARDQTLKKDLDRLLDFWPITYIAAHYRVSTHWVKAAVAVFGLRSRNMRQKPNIVPAGETDFRNLTPHRQRELAATALRQFNGSLPDAAIALGIPPLTFTYLARELKVLDWAWSVVSPRKQRHHQNASPVNKRQAPTRFTPDECQRIRDEIDEAGSIALWAKSRNMSYVKAARWAKKAGNTRVRPQEGEHGRAMRILDYLAKHPNEPEHSTEWWAVQVIYPDRDETWGKWEADQTRKALRAAGLKPKWLKFGFSVWTKPGKVL